ncbi:hypothetical protein MSIMFI_05534 [Mycobacterium simulans]|nr:hypothetical protein MSIMFI_05534 [Mycobacterium simulans]
MAAPVLSESVQKRVRRSVIGLPRRAQHRGHRGEQDERVQPGVDGQLVQIPRRVGLGGQHRIQLPPRQLADHTIIKDPAGMNDRTEPTLSTHLLQHRRQLRTLTDITSHQVDLSAQLTQPLTQRLGPGGPRPAPRGQHHMAHPIRGDQMLGEHRAQHPGPPGDQHRTLGIEHRRRQQHNLAAMPGLTHILKRLHRAHQPVTGRRQRRQHPVGEPLGQHRPRRLQLLR